MKVKLIRIILGIVSLFFSVIINAQVRTLTLTNGYIAAEITPDIGGRLLSFSVVNNPNILKVGESVNSNPNPEVTPESKGINYWGHEVWAGPQSEWWAHQSLNAKRAEEKATWPPDPYIAFAKNTLLSNTAKSIVMQTPESPISGLSFTKTFSLLATKKNSFELKVAARNSRHENVAWDIWFNTRVDANTQLYVPVKYRDDIRVKPSTSTTKGPLLYEFQHEMFSLDISTPIADKNTRKGKFMIQPSEGWLASFRKNQLLIIQFKHQPLSAIHPEQGQIEVYGDFSIDKLDEGLVEIEVHSPYKNLKENQSMTAKEVWTVFPYGGENTKKAQLDFLCLHTQTLGLKKCVRAE